MPPIGQKRLGLAVLGVLLVSSCSSTGPPPPPPERVPPAARAANRPVVALKVLENAFDSNRLTLKSNVPVTISVTNTTAHAHNMTVKDPEGHRVVDVKIPVGQTVDVPFAPTTPGTYIFYCNRALHRALGGGEEGTIEVR
ncbi:MAG: cupredoxin domain-containing protein [bacterium]